MARIGVLLMAYGTPRSLEDVEAYYTHIRGGRPPSPERVAELQERYRRIGGRSPLFEITLRQAQALEARLARLALGHSFRIRVGMKHSPPFIDEAVAGLLEEGIERLVAIALAPHYSRMSVGAYHAAVREALARRSAALPVAEIRGWGSHPLFVIAVAERLKEALEDLPRQETMVIFTAHSLPARLREEGDPYETELLDSARRVARVLGLDHWRFAYQSASATGEPWLGPDLLEVLEAIARQGEARHVVVCPIGFLADHLEILYDLDVEAREAAEGWGLSFRRTRSLNDDPLLIETLMALVSEALAD
ncbi:ferrochelatase [Thermoflexus sp.]|uniref:ferrochelatase n=1 Tax=Thermoflexus sp. TaxID=1969742 RepID=UPI0035E434BE